MDLGLAGRRFAVTAGSRGLGFATAQALARDGARVLIAARDPDRTREAVDLLGPDALGIALDLAAPGAPATLAVTAREAWGALDGLVVNVGGPAPGRSLEYSDEQWDAAIEGVLLASVRTVREMVPVLAPGAAILVILSTTVREPIAGLGASNVLRPGLAMLVKELSRDLAPAIRVNGILPGRIATARTVALDGADPASRRAQESVIPLGRYGDPEEFGRVAAFLVSPAASYVTGSLVAVDGGLLHSPW
ncbi:MAG: SDR family NAD(P)-dependent oxidoreductase [bacterium]